MFFNWMPYKQRDADAPMKILFVCEQSEKCVSSLPPVVVCHLCFAGVCFAGRMEAVGAYHPLVGHRGINR